MGLVQNIAQCFGGRRGRVQRISPRRKGRKGIQTGAMLCQRVQPLLLRRGLQIPGGGHSVRGRDRDIHLKRTKFTKKLALVQIRQGMPTFGIVNRWLGVPLCDLVLISDMAHPRKIPGDADPKGGLQGHGGPGQQGLFQINGGDIGGIGMPIFPTQLLPVDPKFQRIHSSSKAVRRKSKSGTSTGQLLLGKGGTR